MSWNALFVRISPSSSGLKSKLMLTVFGTAGVTGMEHKSERDSTGAPHEHGGVSSRATSVAWPTEKSDLSQPEAQQHAFICPQHHGFGARTAFIDLALVTHLEVLLQRFQHSQHSGVWG